MVRGVVGEGGKREREKVGRGSKAGRQGGSKKTKKEHKKPISPNQPPKENPQLTKPSARSTS